MTSSGISTLDQDAALRDRVRELMANTFVMDAAELPDDASQATCGRWTSLYHMMLLVVLEEDFGVSFSMDEMTSMTSLPRIVDVLKAHGASA
jgi:acyl carrier protein